MQSNPALTETPFLFKMVLEALTWAKARKIKYLKSVKKQNYNYSHMNRKLILQKITRNERLAAQPEKKNVKYISIYQQQSVKNI